MKQRLDLDGRYSHGGYPAVDQGMELTVGMPSGLTISRVSWSDFTAAPAYETLNPLIFQWPTKQSLLHALVIDHEGIFRDKLLCAISVSYSLSEQPEHAKSLTKFSLNRQFAHDTVRG